MFYRFAPYKSEPATKAEEFYFFMYITSLSFGKGTLVILWNEHMYNFYVLSNEGYGKLRDNFVKAQ
jgi:hypothetical protein